MYLLKNVQQSIGRLKKKREIGKLLRRYQHTAIKCSTVTPDDHSKVKPVFRYANEFSERTALHDVHGEFTYRTLFNSSLQLSKEISRLVGHKPNERVAFLCPNDVTYIMTQWAAWMAGQIVVPLSKLHPPNLLEYYITDSNAGLLITTPDLSDSISSLSVRNKSKLLILEDSLVKDALVRKEVKYVDKAEQDIVEPNSSPKEEEDKGQGLKCGGTSTALTGEEMVEEALTDKHGKVVLDKESRGSVDKLMSRPPEALTTLDAGFEPEFYQNSDAMIIYTSGTTGPPKGVVVSHQNIHSQVQAMVSAWGWTQKDIILHTLPLHHVHGITNALITPLSVGAKVVMLPEWNPSEVWSHLLAIKKVPEDRINMFMGVPTMYSKLIKEYDALFADNKRQADFIRAVLSQKIRLMVSGSAPLPEPLLTRWQEISGHVLLERYGMTETGMVLSNPLEGERRPGTVGVPLPGVRVRIVSKEQPDKVLAVSDERGHTEVQPGCSSATNAVVGDLEVKGANVFRAYWNKPNATAKEFTPDGWFKTGDTVEYVNGYYRILGRTSVDIIKTGGFKVSALDVETALLGHDRIQDVAVVGVPDLTWGEKVAAVVVLKPEQHLDLAALREWSKEKLAPYAVPTELKLVDSIPRNNMGKINKKELVKTLFVVK